MAGKLWPFGAPTQPSEDLTDNHVLGGGYEDSVLSGNKQRQISFLRFRTWLSDYFSKGEQKLLWTGPLSAVGVETFLDSGESFDDWDFIVFTVSYTSDASTFTRTPVMALGEIGYARIRTYGNDGYLVFSQISSTSFELQEKTVTAGSIQRIVGYKL